MTVYEKLMQKDPPFRHRLGYVGLPIALEFARK